MVAIQEVLRIWRKGEDGRKSAGTENSLSLFISVISRLWRFSSTKLQQHRKHEHKSAQLTDCLSLYGRTQRIKSIDEKIIHEPKKKNPKLWWRWGWCCGGQWTLRLLSSTFVHTENCSVVGWSRPPLTFVLDSCSYTYIYIYIGFIEVPTEMAGNYTDIWRRFTCFCTFCFLNTQTLQTWGILEDGSSLSRQTLAVRRPSFTNKTPSRLQRGGFTASSFRFSFKPHNSIIQPFKTTQTHHVAPPRHAVIGWIEMWWHCHAVRHLHVNRLLSSLI